MRKRHNFLHAKPVRGGRHPAVRGMAAAFVALGTFLGVAVLLALPLWFLGERTYADAESGKAALERAQAAAEELRFADAAALAAQAEADFSSAQDGIRWVLPFRVVPVVGPHVAAADRLLASGAAASHAVGGIMAVADDLTSALRQSQEVSSVLTGSLPDVARMFKDLSPRQKRDVLAAFHDGAPQMAEALRSIDDSLYALDAIPEDGVSARFTSAVAPLRQKLLRLREALALMHPVAERAPAILGYPEARRYLFFFQNDTELRPTGGFLGVYGMATVQDADLVGFSTDDIYAIDGPAESSARPVPPAPLQKYLGASKWFLRDANWSPDFVASSAQMARFYADEHKAGGKGDAPRVDGIIAIDTKVAEDVLRLTGPVTVGKKTFTPENVVDELEFAVEKGFVSEGVAYHERKQVVGDLAQAVVDRLQSMSLAQLREALKVAERNLDEGHVLLAAYDPNLENMILERDWGGKMKPVRGDYLSWVDANLASLKSDPAVVRTLSYSIRPDGDGFVGTAAMRYEHRGRFDWKTTRYRTYARVYVPAGTQLLGVDGAMENDKIKDPARRPGTADVVDELQRRSFGAFVAVEPGESRTLTFRFRLAPSVVAAVRKGEYRLDVEKQAGTVAHGLTLDLGFGKKLAAAAPAEPPQEWGNDAYRVSSDLRLDRTFEIGF